MKKIALIVLGAIVSVMGLAEITGILNLGTEPAWHAWIKIIAGAAALVISFIYAKYIDSALFILSGALVLMGIVAIVPGLNVAVEPLWHAIAKIVIGGAGIYIAYMKKK